MMRNTSTKPVLRFPEFKEDWKKETLNKVFIKKSIKNKGSKIKTVLTNSATQGIILQNDYFDKEIANQNNLEGYYIVEVDDFVYNPRISVSAPVGPLKRNKLCLGVMSPLYTVLKNLKGELGFFEFYFESGYWYKYMRSIANYGARHDRMNITSEGFQNLPVPYPALAEQKKIADFLIQIDNRIAQLTEKKEHLELYKKGITQKIFSQKLRFKDENGKDFPAWEIKKLKDVFSRKSNKNKGSLIKNVLTNSATRGIISQGDYFDKDIANQNNLEGYYIVDVDDFVYNPRISVSAPVGPLKRNHLVKGVMSPLYTVLKPKIGNLCFYEHYFQTSFWYKYMRGIANYGVRHDRMNITNDDFEKLPLPFPHTKEQEKIASFLNEISQQISLVNEQLEETRTFKKALLSKLFC